ncbi:hypothetical protein D6774_02060, partial [Candidatus Woesearchaeota archaeon]
MLLNTVIFVMAQSGTQSTTEPSNFDYAKQSDLNQINKMILLASNPQFSQLAYDEQKWFMRGLEREESIEKSIFEQLEQLAQQENRVEDYQKWAGKDRIIRHIKGERDLLLENYYQLKAQLEEQMREKQPSRKELKQATQGKTRAELLQEEEQLKAHKKQELITRINDLYNQRARSQNTQQKIKLTKELQSLLAVYGLIDDNILVDGRTRLPDELRADLQDDLQKLETQRQTELQEKNLAITSAAKQEVRCMKPLLETAQQIEQEAAQGVDVRAESIILLAKIDRCAQTSNQETLLESIAREKIARARQEQQRQQIVEDTKSQQTDLSQELSCIEKVKGDAITLYLRALNEEDVREEITKAQTALTACSQLSSLDTPGESNVSDMLLQAKAQNDLQERDRIVKAELLASAREEDKTVVQEHLKEQWKEEIACRKNLLETATNIKLRALQGEDVSQEIEQAYNEISSCEDISPYSSNSLEESIRNELHQAEYAINSRKTQGKDAALSFEPPPLRVLGHTTPEGRVINTQVPSLQSVRIKDIKQPVGQTLNVGAKWQRTGPTGNDLRYVLLGDITNTRETLYAFNTEQPGVYIVQFQYNNNGKPVTFEWEYCAGDCENALAQQHQERKQKTSTPSACDEIIEKPLYVRDLPNTSPIPDPYAIMIEGVPVLWDNKIIEQPPRTYHAYTYQGKTYCVKLPETPSTPSKAFTFSTPRGGWPHCTDEHILAQLDVAETEQVTNRMVIQYYFIHYTGRPYRQGMPFDDVIEQARKDRVNLEELSKNLDSPFVGCLEPIKKKPRSSITTKP